MPVVRSIEYLGGSGPLLGLDPGRKRIGVAISDPDRRVAASISTIHRHRLADDMARLREIVDTRKADAAVVGLPINMSGSEGPMAQSARSFARNLSDALGLTVVLWDERLSTRAAKRALREGGAPRHKQEQMVDASAAAYILQGALDRLAELRA